MKITRADESMGGIDPSSPVLAWLSYMATRVTMSDLDDAAYHCFNRPHVPCPKLKKRDYFRSIEADEWPWGREEVAVLKGAVGELDSKEWATVREKYIDDEKAYLKAQKVAFDKLERRTDTP